MAAAFMSIRYIPTARVVLLVLASLNHMPHLMSEDNPRYRRADAPIEARIADLLDRMTLEEKIDQLHQGSVGDTNPNNIQRHADALRPTYGSFIISGPQGVLAMRNALQRRAVEETRLGIPVLFGADVIHGYRAITPIPLAQACTWDPDLIRRGCSIAAEVSRAHGIDWTFAPMVDHCVDPRWGRIAETFGESPHAASVYSVASVRGFQGNDLTQPSAIASCLKHYVGYGASEGGRDYSYTELSSQTLWEMHLPPFEAGVQAGARSVMSAFNDLSGVPASANPYTLTEILRHRWEFNGLVVSDWNSVLQLTHQGFAGTESEAVEKAIQAGVDLDMADGLYDRHLGDLVAAGRVPLATIDEAVRRVLRVKFELGLFERPFTEPSAYTDTQPPAAHLDLAEELAARSTVLLKNNGVLPLAANARRIGMIGPLAHAAAPLLGSWAQQGRPEETATLRDALIERLPPDMTLRHAEGCSIEGTSKEGFGEAVKLAGESDIVILCLGEDRSMSGENASRSTLRLPGCQEELALAVAAAGKPVILVLVSGRPVEIAVIAERMHGILAAWQGGSRAGGAVADILLGRRNPAGRLCVTWPRSTGQIPIYHNMRPRARLGQEGAYQDIPTTPLYEFGHGLSYTKFSISPIRLERATVSRGERLRAEVTVTNTGPREGRETVFWYIRDPAASITRPLKQLKHFEQASIAAGASRSFQFTLEPGRDLSFPDSDGRRILEPGEILLMANDQIARFNHVNDTQYP